MLRGDLVEARDAVEAALSMVGARQLPRGDRVAVHGGCQAASTNSLMAVTLDRQMNDMQRVQPAYRSRCPTHLTPSLILSFPLCVHEARAMMCAP